MKSKIIRIAVIIPTYNRIKYLKVLLRQLLNQNIQSKIILMIIVVVDESTDRTNNILKTEFPEIYIVKGTGNWWYTKSMNEGFKYAENLKPDFVLTLNDDVEIQHNYISNLILAYQKVEEGSIIGSLCVSINKPHVITSSGNKIRNKFFGLYKHNLPFMSVINLKELSGIKETVTLPGRGMLISICTLKQLNYFDEAFIQYHSDGDFCLRAHKIGYGVYISWDAVVFSHINLTSSSSSFKKQSLKSFINSFFDSHSRNYILDKLLYIWRHNTKLGMPLVLLFNLLLTVKNYYFKKKLA